MTQTFVEKELYSKFYLSCKWQKGQLALEDNEVAAISAELIGSLKLGTVWVFVRLIFGPRWPMNQMNKNPNIS